MKKDTSKRSAGEPRHPEASRRKRPRARADVPAVTDPQAVIAVDPAAFRRMAVCALDLRETGRPKVVHWTVTSDLGSKKETAGRSVAELLAALRTVTEELGVAKERVRVVIEEQPPSSRRGQFVNVAAIKSACDQAGVASELTSGSVKNQVIDRLHSATGQPKQQGMGYKRLAVVAASAWVSAHLPDVGRAAFANWSGTRDPGKKLEESGRIDMADALMLALANARAA